ncbi:MAG: cytochrome c oxidase accessory protein CcoG [Colwellia sp.]|nr:cytochrome c oxidase accessory protein CcoG [Colwellia sp.]
MSKSHLSKENLIFKTPVNEKIYLREQKGLFQKIRRSLSIVLMAIFVFIPFIQYKGMQAVFFDLQQQKLHIFSFTLYPQDLYIVSLGFILAAFLLFYVTQFFGRIWCGFTCPQTIWMLIFNWVERRVEGTHNQSKSLDIQSLSRQKVIKKLTKHLIWSAISLFTSLVFISYFVTVEQLYLPFFTFQSSTLVVSWVVFFAVCTYINAGWIREKMCQHMCPYSRIQSAMFDQSTKLVSYDQTRGENRGKRKLSQVKSTEMGDCVDCNLCVQVCPVGIDIRNGLQYECINCGLCIDACDMTMDKFNYQKGLISFAAENQEKQGWQRHLGYGIFVAITIFMMFIWLNSWQSYEVSIIRDRQALYRVNHKGEIENTFILKIRNKSNQTSSYQIQVNGLVDARIIGHSIITIQPGELQTSSLVVMVDQPPAKNRNDISFNIINLDNNTSLLKTTSFYSDNIND